MNTAEEVVNIKSGKFKEIDVKGLDSKNRISLSKKVLKFFKKVDAFKIFVGKEGDILLRPMVNIPARESWIYENTKALSQVRQGLAEARAGKTEKVNNLDKFFENL